MSAAFHFEARAPSGRVERGVIDAPSADDAVSQLYNRGLTPLSVKERRNPQASARLSDKSARDLSRTLAQTLRAGLTLNNALRFASDDLDPHAAHAARLLREAIERGEPASSALETIQGPQARLLAGVLRAGETSGKLADALELAAKTFADGAAMQARLATALIYPAFVLIATIATLAVFMLLVVPTLGTAFEGAEAALPQSTKALLALSAWMQGDGLVAFSVVAALTALAAANPVSRRALSQAMDVVLLTPVGLGVSQRLDFAQFANLAGLSLSAGTPIAVAFEAASGGMRNSALRPRIAAAIDAIRAGVRPSRALDQAARPPKALLKLMQVGEETGGLGAAMTQAGALMSAEAEQRLGRVGAIAGPVVTLGLGGLVASVVVSLFLGLLSLSDMAGAP